jgi:hypothetical protein
MVLFSMVTTQWLGPFSLFGLIPWFFYFLAFSCVQYFEDTKTQELKDISEVFLPYYVYAILYKLKTWRKHVDDNVYENLPLNLDPKAQVPVGATAIQLSTRPTIRLLSQCAASFLQELWIIAIE